MANLQYLLVVVIHPVLGEEGEFSTSAMFCELAENEVAEEIHSKFG